jgi:hypothetical protein
VRHCFWTFKRLYPHVAKHGYDIEVLHAVQVVDRLLKEDKLRLTTSVPYEGHLSRSLPSRPSGRNFVPLGRPRDQDLRSGRGLYPPRPRYNGAFGVYEPPRDVLRAIPAWNWWRWNASAKLRGAAAPAVPRLRHTRTSPPSRRQTSGRSAVHRRRRYRHGVSELQQDAGAAVARRRRAMKTIDVLELVEQAL